VSPLRFGHAAPDFSLPSTSGGAVSLADFRDRADVVVVFYCYDFGRIWSPELGDLGEVATKVVARGAAVLAISGDSPFCHEAFHRAHAPRFPLLSDVHRTAIRAYGVLDEERNVAYRSTFIIDREGLLRWGQAGDREMVRDGAEILRVLDLIAARRGR
jgi:mycoredoxin-dependent peroxiredoxin